MLGRRGDGRAVVAVVLTAVATLACATASDVSTQQLPSAFLIVGDGIPQRLSAQAGDVARGKAIVGNRQQGMCLLCHSGPAEDFPHERTPGSVAGSLAGAGSRWTEAQLRLRVADARALNAQSVMPSYHRSNGLQQVAAAFEGRTLLSAQQLEDVVAYLVSLR